MLLFDKEIAKEVGANAAVVFNHIKYWCEYNSVNGKNMKEGKCWMYDTAQAMSNFFEYMTERQIRTAIEKLVKNNYLEVGKFNDNPFSQTHWYSIKPHVTKMLDDNLHKRNLTDYKNVSCLHKNKTKEHNNTLFKPETIFDDFLKQYNKAKKEAGHNGQIRLLDSKCQTQLQYLLKNDYSIAEIIKALKNALNDKFHSESGFRYVTPEYITRVKIFNKYHSSQIVETAILTDTDY